MKSSNPQTPAQEASAILHKLGAPASRYNSGDIEVRSPINGESMGRVRSVNAEAANRAIDQAHVAFLAWRNVPAPQRGELVRMLGEELRANRTELGRLVTLEAGKILSEGVGEEIGRAHV